MPFLGMTRYEKVCQPLVAVVAISLNIPPVVLGIIAAANWCPYYGKFLVPNAVICIVNIAAVFYSIYKLRKKVAFDTRHNLTEETEDEEGGELSNVARIRNNKAADDADATNASWTTNPLADSVVASPKIVNGKQISNGSNGDARHTSDLEEQQDLNQPEEVNAENESASAPRTPRPQSFSTRQISTASDGSKAPHSCFKRCVKLRTTSSNRIRHLVCYNGLMTTYGILFLFWAFWLGSGEQMALNMDDANDEKLEGCTEAHLEAQYQYVHVSAALGFAYFAFVMACLFASFCDSNHMR